MRSGADVLRREVRRRRRRRAHDNACAPNGVPEARGGVWRRPWTGQRARLELDGREAESERPLQGVESPVLGTVVDCAGAEGGVRAEEEREVREDLRAGANGKDVLRRRAGGEEDTRGKQRAFTVVMWRSANACLIVRPIRHWSTGVH